MKQDLCKNNMIMGTCTSLYKKQKQANPDHFYFGKQNKLSTEISIDGAFEFLFLKNVLWRPFEMKTTCYISKTK